MRHRRDVENPMSASADAAALTSPGTLEELYAEHARSVFVAAYRVTGSAEDAEDVLQTVFLRLARRDELPDLAPSPGCYLRRAGVNAALDLVRRRARKREFPHDVSEPVDEATASPERTHRGRELADRLRSALSEVSPMAGEVFVLSRIEGYGNREIARLVGSTPGSVAVLLHRAGRRLRELLRDLDTSAGERR
jgi:RNA polymerase sigma-70 factor (ECF subfamily)